MLNIQYQKKSKYFVLKLPDTTMNNFQDIHNDASVEDINYIAFVCFNNYLIGSNGMYEYLLKHKRAYKYPLKRYKELDARDGKLHFNLVDEMVFNMIRDGLMKRGDIQIIEDDPIQKENDSDEKDRQSIC